MRILLLSLLLTGICGFTSARSPQNIEYFDDAYRQPKGELSLSGGVSPYFILNGYYSTGWKCNIGYSAYIIPHFSIGGSVSYITNSELTCFVPMLYGKYNWLNTKYCSLYIRFAVGVNIYNTYDASPSCLSPGYSKGLTYAFMLSPAGIELGKDNVWFYAELGFEYMPVTEAGIKIRF